MRVYKHAEKELNTTLIVQPGIMFPDVEGWMTEERNMEDIAKPIRRPTVFNVKFNNGMAEVDHNLGKFLLDQKYVERSPRPSDYVSIESPVQFNDVTTKQVIKLPV